MSVAVRDRVNCSVPVLRFPEFEEVGGWEVRRLGEVAERLVDWEEFVHGSERLRIGDFSCAMMRSGDESGGFIARYVGERNRAVSSGVLFLQIDRESVFLDYLGYLFESPLHGPRILQRLKDSVDRSSGFDDDWTDIAIPLPPEEVLHEEQEKVANFLSAIDELIDAKRDEVSDLWEFRRGASERYFSGKDEGVSVYQFSTFLSDFDRKMVNHRWYCDLLKEMKLGLLQRLFPKIESIDL